MKRPLEEAIHQILRINGGGKTVLHSWHLSEEIAELELTKAREVLDFEDVWIERGTDYISPRCDGCQSIYSKHRYDLNGIRRGFWCDECFNSDELFLFPRPETS